ncbi:diaminopropionate ammonia-lyase [Fictibacillus phosphorivorans]|uniref:diaminopropionate ammonia-lyase n=1 Tax=Fictibacillus phosphorivorans TaxID=1221500 RepID=UPI00203B8416|nr:diaminopropionate ammonia-lyase [Fictibacillus phosphorivorans]MCM3776087.1 diaminopropionate ammonia-lyase [Fictibacillus phosphorivorans]
MQQTKKENIQWQINEKKKPYSSKVLHDFTNSEIKRVYQFQKTHPLYNETPLVRLSNLAAELGVEEIFVKNEACRFGLNAFKVLGGIYAVGKFLAERIGRDIESLSFEELKSPKIRELTGELTFISATDGNHGRGVAWAARELGHKSVIYMPKGSSTRRLEAIKAEGAHAEITHYNYDDAVRLASSHAKVNGWIVIQDTSWEGYEDIPLWIMQGYATISKEIVEQMEVISEEPPTHVFLQAGVGSFASSVAAFLIQHYRERYPKIIVVEPHQANCFYLSFKNKGESFQTVSGDMDTIMAGLACGEPNPRAWDILSHFSEASFSCDDSISALGMRILGNPIGKDQRIISGESGSVTTGLIYCLTKNKALFEVKEKLKINEKSRILLINTEGDTDEAHYRKTVWEGTYPLTNI